MSALMRGSVAAMEVADDPCECPMAPTLAEIELLIIDTRRIVVEGFRIVECAQLNSVRRGGPSRSNWRR